MTKFEIPNFEELIKVVAADLKQLNVSYCLVGGLAVSLQTEPRLTKDIDFAVAVADDAHAEKIVFGLRQRGYVPLATVEQTAAARLGTIRLKRQLANQIEWVVDLLFASCGIESEICMEAEELALSPSLTLRVADKESLIAMKILARSDRKRPQDYDDIFMLLKELSFAQTSIKRVEHFLELITSRGFNRGKKLVEEFRSLVAELQLSMKC